eukprot:1085573_1
MVLLSGLIDLILITLLITNTISQNILCVWNAQSPWQHLNGEYELQNDALPNNQPYWTKHNTSCSSLRPMIYAVQYGFLYYWVISPTLTLHLSQIDDLPICSANGEPYNLPTNPTVCAIGYHANEQSLSLSITTGTCPSSLSCTTLQITGASDTCNGIFEKDDTQSSIYTRTQGTNDTHLYFNPHTYKWHCAHTLEMNQCNGSQHSILSSQNAQWNDFEQTNAFTLPMIHSNGDSFNVQFECIDIIYTMDTTSIMETTSSITVDRKLEMKPFKLPKMPCAIDFVGWYVILALACVICCALVALRWSIRRHRYKKRVQQAQTMGKKRGASIVITPPQTGISNKKISKQSAVSASSDSIEMPSNKPATNMKPTISGSVNYGRYDDYRSQERLKLTRNKTGTIEMQSNQLYIVKDDQDEDDLGMTMETLTEDRILETPSTTQQMIHMKNTGLGFKGSFDLTLNEETMNEDTRATITFDAYDDIYGKYEPETTMRKDTLPTRTATSMFGHIGTHNREFYNQ